MTDATPCALIVGARAKDGGQPCGHPADEHVPYGGGAFPFSVCRPCREAGVKWTVDYPDGVTGADHRPTPPRSAPPRRRSQARAE